MKKSFKNFGDNLKAARLKSGMSQLTFAGKLGVDRAYLSAIENGRQNPTLETIEKIAKALKIGPHELTKINKDTNLKTAGIIGGMGPETTSEFYLEILFACQKRVSTKRPRILIYNVPLPFDIEEALILGKGGPEPYLPFLVEAAQTLEKAGADFLVIPCNSVHGLIEAVRASVTIPVLSIIEETALFLSHRRVSQAGIIATDIVLNSGLYEDALRAVGITHIQPDGYDQAKIGKMILNLVSSRHDNKDRESLQRIVEGFSEKGVDHVILACTDLQLLIPRREGMEVFDTMKILAESTVEHILN